MGKIGSTSLLMAMKNVFISPYVTTIQHHVPRSITLGEYLETIASPDALTYPQQRTATFTLASPPAADVVTTATAAQATTDVVRITDNVQHHHAASVVQTAFRGYLLYERNLASHFDNANSIQDSDTADLILSNTKGTNLEDVDGDEEHLSRKTRFVHCFISSQKGTSCPGCPVAIQEICNQNATNPRLFRQYRLTKGSEKLFSTSDSNSWIKVSSKTNKERRKLCSCNPIGKCKCWITGCAEAETPNPLLLFSCFASTVLSDSFLQPLMVLKLSVKTIEETSKSYRK